LKKLKADFSLYLKNTGTTPGYALDVQGQVYQTTIASFTMLDLVFAEKVLEQQGEPFCRYKKFVKRYQYQY